MRLLLDTHVAIWWFNDPRGIRPETREELEDPANEAILSAVSVWEAGVKQVVGRLTTPLTLDESARRFGLSELPISWEHARVSTELPRLHADPFDRLLVAQAHVEKLVLVTGDPAIQRYDVATMAA